MKLPEKVAALRRNLDAVVPPFRATPEVIRIVQRATDERVASIRYRIVLYCKYVVV